MFRAPCEHGCARTLANIWAYGLGAVVLALQITTVYLGVLLNAFISHLYDVLQPAIQEKAHADRPSTRAGIIAGVGRPWALVWPARAAASYLSASEVGSSYPFDAVRRRRRGVEHAAPVSQASPRAAARLTRSVGRRG